MAMRKYPGDMFDEMERMMDTMRRSMMGGMRDTREWADGMFDSNITLERDDERVLVHADLPGFETSEIDLRFDDGVLHIDATHEVSGDAGAVTATRSRSVSERVRVPGEVLVDEITASYRNGVLEVTLPLESPEADDDHTRIDID